MIRSMTGYGRADVERDGARVSVEVWSVNHRYFDLSVRLPKALASLESRVRRHVQDNAARGKITLVVNWHLEPERAAKTLHVDAGRLSSYLAIAEELRKQHGVSGKLELTTVLALPEVVTEQQTEQDLEFWWECLEEAVGKAVSALMTLRASEGENLAKDVLERLDEIEKLLGKVERRAPERVREAKEKITQRINQILDSAEVEPFRLEQEIAFQADRMDFTEECVRLRSHIKHFREFAREDDSAGRKLNFLLQEMNREATTIGAKANDAEVSQYTVRLKEELERVREQVQNVE